MKISINDHRKIVSIQQEFSELFPYLKLEFFSRLHKAGDGSAKKDIVPSIKTLAECRTIHGNGAFNITPKMSVAELEQTLRKEYGLSVQVFRKSGKAWLETTMTDSWTLEEQNQQGEALSNR